MRIVYGKISRVAVFFLIFLVGCTSNVKTAKKKEPLHIIDLDNKSTGQLLYSSIFRSVRVVLLDNEKVLLNNIHKMLIHKNEMYVLDKKQGAVFVFDNTGKMSRQIGRRGVAPQEYASCRDFAIDYKNELVYIYDSQLHRIYMYRTDTGDFLRYIGLARDVDIDFITSGDGYLYAAQTSSHSKEREYYLLHEIDLESGESKRELFSSIDYNKGWSKGFINEQVFYKMTDGSDLFFEGFMDTVMFVRQEIHPYLAMKSKNLIQKEDLPEDKDSHFHTMMEKIGKWMNAGKFLGLRGVFEHQGDLYFSCMYRNGSFVCYDKDTRETQVYTTIVDDVLFQKSPGSYIFPKFLCSDAEGVYYCVHLDALPQMKYFVDEGYIAENVIHKDYLVSSDEDSNPIILFYEYKK